MNRFVVIIGAIVVAILIVASGFAYLILTDRICIEPFCTATPMLIVIPPQNATMERPLLIEDGRVVLSGPREVRVSVFASTAMTAPTLTFGTCIGFESEFIPITEPIALGPLEANTTTLHRAMFDVPSPDGLIEDQYTCYAQVNDQEGSGAAYGSYLLMLTE